MAFRGTTGSVGVFPAVASFRGMTSPVGVFGSVPAEGAGGIGHSWFVVELTSEHVPDVVEPPPKPIVLPVSRPRKLKRVRGEDRFPADFRVVETAGDRFPALYEVITGDRFPAMFGVVESETSTFAASFHQSLRRRNAEEEAVMALLLAEDEWE